MPEDNSPKLSYGAKTLIMEVSRSRRDFLKKSLVTIGGFTFFSIMLSENKKAFGAPPSLTCGCYSDCYGECYSNCHCACHSDCGRKGW